MNEEKDLSKYLNVDYDNIDYETLRSLAIDFSNKYPNSYFNFLNRNKLFVNFKKAIERYTNFLPLTSKITTRIFYIRNNFTEIVRCNTCSNPILREFNGLMNKNIKDIYCDNPDCSCKVGANKPKTRKFSSRNNLPKECIIHYNDTDIVYDEDMNSRLFEFYMNHNKTFAYHIKNEPELYNYLIEKSYPLDYTKLSITTRVKWVLDKMQRLPVCLNCGRQLDFENVKVSHKWHRYCCDECKDTCKEKSESTHIRHSTNMYNRMLNLTDTQLLFSLDDFINRNDDTLFKCHCNKCNSDFEAKWNINFYRREGNFNSYFRCPNCFPSINNGKSNVENEVVDFLKERYNDLEITTSNKKIIRPYELDIYIDSLKFGIEFNGVYWHSLEFDKENYYKHLNKTVMCENNGIMLFHIWEDEWNKDNELVKKNISDIIENSVDLLNYVSNGVIELPRDKFNIEFVKRHNLKVVKTTDIEIIKRKHIANERYYSLTNCGNIVCEK